MSIYEIGMLGCFGAAWPVSIYKSWTTRNSSGKSVVFLFIVLIGYIFGIIHKVFYSMDFVIWFYVLNALMVCADIALTIRNRTLPLIKTAALEPGKDLLRP
ncbi:MAG: hypothetical protein M0Z59_03805 [Nitrospiraceae bacterium]|nr:hypothetical protein [Nitrospiraceae bacterium]